MAQRAYKVIFLHGTGPQSEDPKALEKLEAGWLKVLPDLGPQTVETYEWLDFDPELQFPYPSRGQIAGTLPKSYQILSDRPPLVPTQLTFDEPVQTIGIAGRVAQDVGTWYARKHRVELTELLGEFIQSVVVFEAHRADIDRHFLEHLSQVECDDHSLFVMGHSLGGDVAVDALSSVLGAQQSDYGPLRQKLAGLVTVGSQSPWLYYLHGLSILGSANAPRPVFTPWLNIYDENDFLGFRAAGAFNTAGLTEEQVDSGESFPQSHSAYLDSDKVYKRIAKWVRVLPA